jgi:hypothetical protein
VCFVIGVLLRLTVSLSRLWKVDWAETSHLSHFSLSYSEVEMFQS